MKPNDLIGFARKFAAIAHEDTGQTYDGNPFSKHLDTVASVLLRYEEHSKTMLAAAYLHDVIEDVGISPSTIEDLFGPDVTALVSALTDEPGENRKERKAKTYPKIKGTPGAVKLKLADRIANVENGIVKEDKRFFLMYKKEHPEFEANLRVANGDVAENAMWEHLAYLFRVGNKKFTDNGPL